MNRIQSTGKETKGLSLFRNDIPLLKLCHYRQSRRNGIFTIIIIIIATVAKITYGNSQLVGGVGSNNITTATHTTYNITTAEKNTNFTHSMPPLVSGRESNNITTAAHIINNISVTNFAPFSSNSSGDTICTSVDDMNDGAWNGHAWLPKRCHLRTFTPTQIKQCLKDKKVAFCGDSLLRRVAGNVGRRIDPSITFEKTWGDQSFPLIGLNTYWTPSVYHQQCSSSHGSTIIISETVWNMGTYFKGMDAYEESLRQVLKQRFRTTERLIWFGLHKLHRERPGCQKDTKCYDNNTPEMEASFREIGLRVARESGAEIFDTHGITNTSFTALDGDDAVHHGETTTGVETDVLLNMIC